MKTKLMILGVIIFVAQVAIAQTLSKSNVVARKDPSGTIICDYSKVPTKTIDIPLSELVENIEVVLLDAADEALVANTHAIVSDNYILIAGKDNNPYKLFDKKGKFITKIGGVGQGPGEYKLVYDAQIDEKNKRVYLLPWQSDKLLVFDFTGKALPSYPLAARLPKGKFKVNDDKTITLATLPFKGWTKYVVWNQTLDGKVNNGIDAGQYAIDPDFSNEVFANKNVNTFDFALFMFWGENRDWFNYNYKTNDLKVTFKMNFGNVETPITSYGELPLHYLANFAEPKKVSENTTVTQNHRFLIVDKKTMKGSYYSFKNDFLGDIPFQWANFENGYYVNNSDPGDLKDALEKALKENKNMSNSMKEKVTKLKNSITDNDNNYIIYGKLK